MVDTPGGDRPNNMYRFATAGTEFIFTFGIVLAAGYGLDRWLGTRIVFTLLGAMAGFAGGLYRLIRNVRNSR